MRIVAIILLAGYVLMPTDLIPDAIPFLGTADDLIAGVIAGALARRKR